MNKINKCFSRQKIVNFILLPAFFILSAFFISCNGEEEIQEEPFSMKGIKYLALGDSYTIGESVEQGKTWPFQLAEKLAKEHTIGVDTPKVIARTGWRTDQLLAASLGEGNNAYSFTSLLIGVNNQFQGVDINVYIKEFEELLQLAIKSVGSRPERVLVVSIPDYGYTPFGTSKRETISKELDEYNRINREIAEKYGTRYYYITDISRSTDENLVASDNLHPSGYQYELWVNRILEDADLLNELKSETE